MNARSLSRDVFGYLILVLLLGIIGWIETTHPAGLSLPTLTGGLLSLDTMIRVGMFTIVLVGLNLLMGYAGQVSLGQAAFYGMGAFFSGILTTRAGRLGVPADLSATWWWPWLVIVGGMLFTAAVAYVIGLPILRLRGHYLAMATLGIGVVVYVLLRENIGVPQLNLTGGADGVYGVPRLRIGGFEIWPVERYYVFVWIVAFIVIALGLNIVNSRYGRVLRAIHSSQSAAESVGVAVHQHKAQIFALSAAFASLAGSLYAHFQVAVVPATFGFTESLQLVIMSSVGGLASIWGAPFGAFTILILQEILRTQLHIIFPGAQGELEAVAFGVLLIVIMIFMPEGLTTGSIHAYRRWRATRALKKEIEDSAEIMGAEHAS
jgi:branched-chain amino acid transport system permease protein